MQLEICVRCQYLKLVHLTIFIIAIQASLISENKLWSIKIEKSYRKNLELELSKANDLSNITMLNLMIKKLGNSKINVKNNNFKSFLTFFKALIEFFYIAFIVSLTYAFQWPESTEAPSDQH